MTHRNSVSEAPCLSYGITVSFNANLPCHSITISFKLCSLLKNADTYLHST